MPRRKFRERIQLRFLRSLINLCNPSGDEETSEVTSLGSRVLTDEVAGFVGGPVPGRHIGRVQTS